MKRRKFLGLFGAAAATPFLPAPSVAGAAKAAPYSAAALHAAIYHARSRAVFSVWGMAKALGLTIESAEVLMGDLAKRGIVGPLQGTTYGGRWASSRIMTSEAVALQRTARSKARRSSSEKSQRRMNTEPDLSQLIAHLHQLCRNSGIPLSARCAAF